MKIMRCSLVRVWCLSTLTLRSHGVDVTANKIKYKLNHRKSMRHEEGYTRTILILNWRIRRQTFSHDMKIFGARTLRRWRGKSRKTNLHRIKIESSNKTYPHSRCENREDFAPSHRLYRLNLIITGKIRMCKRTKMLTGRRRRRSDVSSQQLVATAK